jgi:hypothetical protein
VNGFGSLLSLLFIVGAVVVAFIVCREILLWYWKINRVVTLLEQIVQQNGETNQLLAEIGPAGLAPAAVLAAPQPPVELPAGELAPASL